MTRTSYNITIWEFGWWCGGRKLLSYKKKLFEWLMPQKLYNGLKLGLFPNSNESNIWMEACNQLVGWKELFDFLTMRSLNQLLKPMQGIESVSLLPYPPLLHPSPMLLSHQPDRSPSARRCVASHWPPSASSLYLTNTASTHCLKPLTTMTSMGQPGSACSLASASSACLC